MNDSNAIVKSNLPERQKHLEEKIASSNKTLPYADGQNYRNQLEYIRKMEVELRKILLELGS